MYGPKRMARYPHMMAEDAGIWDRFLVGDRWLPDKVWYDVRVGHPLTPPAGSPEYLQRFALASTRKRIDVVAERGGATWIVECKPRAGMMALGQVAFYFWAFAMEYAFTGRLIPVVITDRVDHDVGPLFDEAGVLVFEVGLEVDRPDS